MAIKRKIRDGRVYLEEYQSVRRGKKIKSEFVRYLGPEKPGGEKGYGPILDRIEHGPARHTGAVRLLWKLAEDLKFRETIDRICSQNSGNPDPFSATLLIAWAINRVLGSRSASQLQRWIATTDLPEISGLANEEFSKDAFLCSLDSICGDEASTGVSYDRSDALNMALSEHWRKMHPLPPGMKNILAYDLTNVLFFGVTCPIAKMGRNEKHERRPQVNVAVVVHKYDHSPLTHFVYKGNRNGCRTVRNLLAHMQTANIQPGLLVVDRGIMGKVIVEETTGMGWNLLGGISKGNANALSILSGTEIPETPDTYVKESKSGPVYAQMVTGSIFGQERRLVAYTNGDRAMRERVERNRELKGAGTRLRQLSANSSGKDEATLHREIEAALGDWRPYFKVRVRRGGKKPRIVWKYLDRRLKSASRTDGKYLLLCTDKTLDAGEVVETYFSKDFAEKVFRSLKTDVDVEPVRHRLGHRVRAYLFVCMLAYRLVMALRWRLLESGMTEKTCEFMDRLLEELWEVERIEVRLGGQKKDWYLNVTEFIEDGLKKIGMKSLLAETG